MIEVRFHGRGGQGVVTAADILAMAAFYDGKYCQSFPFFGVERRGAPVTAFSRIDDKPVRRRSQIYKPDYVVVQDPTLLEVIDVTSGLKDEGMVIINTEKKPDEINVDTKAKVCTADATKIALKVLGVPIVNTSMLGVFAAATGEVSLDSLKKAIMHRFSERLAVKNVRAIETAYSKARGSP
ncbi:MAG: pyruvate ferredoxin oxidoreductase subunit gamma [Candidatus Hydrothermarchaeales archaeon]